MSVVPYISYMGTKQNNKMYNTKCCGYKKNWNSDTISGNEK